jgi:hypothetical protein
MMGMLIGDISYDPIHFRRIDRKGSVSILPIKVLVACSFRFDLFGRMRCYFLHQFYQGYFFREPTKDMDVIRISSPFFRKWHSNLFQMPAMYPCNSWRCHFDNIWRMGRCHLANIWRPFRARGAGALWGMMRG